VGGSHRLRRLLTSHSGFVLATKSTYNRGQTRRHTEEPGSKTRPHKEEHWSKEEPARIGAGLNAPKS